MPSQGWGYSNAPDVNSGSGNGLFSDIADVGQGIYDAGKKALGGLFQNRGDNEFRNVDPNNFQLPGYQDRQNQLQGLANQFGAMGAPSMQASQIGQYGDVGESGFRAGQQGLIEQLQRQMSGQDSMAALQAREAAGRNLSQQQALMASARPGQAALAARTAAQQAGNIGQGLAGQEVQARLAERLGAAGQLGGVLQAARQQDFQREQFNVASQNDRLLKQAELAQQAGQENLAAQLKQQAMNNEARLKSLELELQNAQLQQGGALAAENARTSRFGALTQSPTKGEQEAGALTGLLKLL